MLDEPRNGPSTGLAGGRHLDQPEELGRPAIELDALTFSYPDGRKALDGISLAVREGEKVALVGPNGAGKSTLLLHLNGILRGRGMVRIMGTEVGDGNLGAIRSQVGLVFQYPDDQLFSPTVLEDVAFGPLHMNLEEGKVLERVRWALDQVGMAGFEDRVSHHLSLGEKKRIAIATVLAMQPDILALDEPTGELDPRARRGLIRLLRELPQTMVVATHDMRLVKELLPRTVILDRGKVVADGLTEQLLEDTQLLEQHGLEAP
ncbi:MAG: ATP-binding cassette domain-containing protein [Anaerolineae bacterium]|nr:ATP-binding cassette domain-containing protein [Anaerolineae bacterium]NIN99411.1 ATP-binding cassette domain-containing protein [Anaerolineae bacterium]NIQ82276.1 ATP-binding cassette domain-containing protein [Anaerolineae bacterium]